MGSGDLEMKINDIINEAGFMKSFAKALVPKVLRKPAPEVSASDSDQQRKELFGKDERDWYTDQQWAQLQAAKSKQATAAGTAPTTAAAQRRAQQVRTTGKDIGTVGTGPNQYTRASTGGWLDPTGVVITDPAAIAKLEKSAEMQAQRVRQTAQMAPATAGSSIVGFKKKRTRGV